VIPREGVESSITASLTDALMSDRDPERGS